MIIQKILIILLIMLPCFSEEITEQTIMKKVWQLDKNGIKQDIEYLEQNQHQFNEFDYYYYKAKLTEGLLRYYEVKDNNQKIALISEKGIKITEKALSINPKHGSSHVLMSRFLAKTLSWHNIYSVGPMVLHEIELAEKYDPQNPEVILARINQYLYTPSQFGGNLDLAYEKLKEFTEKYPENEDGFFNYAIACKFKGLQKDAIENLKAIIERNPNNLSAQKELKNMGINI